MSLLREFSTLRRAASDYSYALEYRSTVTGAYNQIYKYWAGDTTPYLRKSGMMPRRNGRFASQGFSDFLQHFVGTTFRSCANCHNKVPIALGFWHRGVPGSTCWCKSCVTARGFTMEGEGFFTSDNAHERGLANIFFTFDADILQHRKGFLGSIGKPNTIYYGVELELISRTTNRSTLLGYKHLFEEFAIAKQDGSLPRDRGFEIVTVPATLEYHQTKWPQFLPTEFRKEIMAWSRPECGIHIHASKAPIPPLTQGRLVKFMYDEENWPFLIQLAGRDWTHNRYTLFKAREGRKINPPHMGMLCFTPEYIKRMEALDKKTPDKWNDLAARRRHPDIDKYLSYKYQPLNFLKEKTIECRIFRATSNPRRILSYLEFYDSLIQYCHQASNKSLKWKPYLEWFGNQHRDTYPNLRSWLADYGILNTRLNLINLPTETGE